MALSYSSKVSALGEKSRDQNPADLEESPTKDGSSHPLPQADAPDIQQLIRRIDRRLIITAGLMYCVSLIDRANLGAANIAGMSVDLGLNIGYRYVSLSVLSS